MQCEMCGKTISKPITIIIEGSELQVCESCAKFGKRKLLPKTSKKEQNKQIFSLDKQKNQINKTKNLYKNYYNKTMDLEEDVEYVENYGEKIKKKREKMGLSQEDLAKKLNIKSNILHRIETGHLELDIHIAKKLEKALNLKLIETKPKDDKKENLLNSYSLSNKTTDELTLGSMAKIRVRKRK